jgi:predicted DNA-binding protein
MDKRINALKISQSKYVALSPIAYKLRELIEKSLVDLKDFYLAYESKKRLRMG